MIARSATAQPRLRGEPAPSTPPYAAQPSLSHGILAVFGEVRSLLLPTAVALQRGEVEDLLALDPDHRVRWRTRPISLGISSEVLNGVDCALAAPSHPAVRAIGTVARRGVVVGGRVLQSSARCTVVRSAHDKRQGWDHYLARAGVLEVIAKVSDATSARLTEGFLATRGGPTLDLESITAGLVNDIGMRRLGRAPLRAGTTRLRWAARIGDVDSPRVSFRLLDDVVRAALIVVPSEPELMDAQRFCEDLAVHDWLLTVLTDAIERADLAGPASPEATEIIAPVLQHLAHLWLPEAHTPPELRGLWTQLQADAALTAEWRNSVAHLRNRVMMAMWSATRPNRIGYEV
nr:SCO2521 family protein [Nocardia bovistercoris]